jgi:hemoglobin
MKEIQTYEEVLFLIERFYEKLVADPLIGHFFQYLDLSRHISNVADFWAFILLDQPGYLGNMVEAHRKLPLTNSDFDQWLFLFHQTIDEHFEGKNALIAKERSNLIALTLRSKL